MGKPWLDLSASINEPQFQTNFVVLRRQQIVDTHGQPQTVVIGRYQALGVITPTGSNSLVRADAYESQMETIQVITMYRLRPASKDAQGITWLPDYVLWSGSAYVVRTLNDFAQYGAGFMVAECIQVNYNDVPTPEFQPNG